MAVQLRSPSNLMELEGSCKETPAEKLPKNRCVILVAPYSKRLEAVTGAKDYARWFYLPQKELIFGNILEVDFIDFQRRSRIRIRILITSLCNEVRLKD
ncbi:hypothetical protein QTP70_003025 [Hemibagrus guttatus]|uniref:Uncharacterized protein n=1 Tax=Hemibagrus guttatus TaxID=175788 RepID=A0AAE0V3I5_9TELE|nr:hypothetical protein QTP70_003025 [Hemibagrus guttatus]KAK3564087.1 hypothetical protein QTP86_007510 [Hemibagrus guttatus]